jgi:hypothetical protein
LRAFNIIVIFIKKIDILQSITGTENIFAVEVHSMKVSLSREHDNYSWLTYEEAIKLLKWDSNKTALWELKEKINLKLL